MKLPTLNVDVKVNTSTMKKDIERANKELQNIGGKGAAFLGGGVGKIGSLGSLGGAAGSAFVGIAGIAAAAMAPLKISTTILDALSQSAKDAEQTLRQFSETGKFTGMSSIQAQQIAAGGPAEERRGLWDTLKDAFAATSANIPGGSMLGNWADNTYKGAQWIAGAVGAMAAQFGQLEPDIDAIFNQADLSVVSSEQEARQLFRQDELRMMDANQRKFQKQMRETTT